MSINVSIVCSRAIGRTWRGSGAGTGGSGTGGSGTGGSGTRGASGGGCISGSNTPSGWSRITRNSWLGAGNGSSGAATVWQGVKISKNMENKYEDAKCVDCGTGAVMESSGVPDTASKVGWL